MRSTQKKLVDWRHIDTVMLDMDGTLLDLHFDNEFWSRHLPLRYAQLHQLKLEESHRRLAPVFSEHAGHLNWYCTNFWSEITGLDIMTLKREIADLIGPLPGAKAFLDAVSASGRKLWLVTNAHPDSVRLKLERTGLGSYFEYIIASHDFGFAKEEPQFWPALAATHPFCKARALFVDDSPAVVASAHTYGIGQVVALSRPDSRGTKRAHTHAQVAQRLVELLPLA